jgi:hypothetical protein
MRPGVSLAVVIIMYATISLAAVLGFLAGTGATRSARILSYLVLATALRRAASACERAFRSSEFSPH